MTQSTDPTQRFSNRVAEYARYRPAYPTAIVHTLRDDANLQPASVVADIGSGTGISSRLFLEHGCAVYAVEPNREMRRAAESLLGGYGNFHSVAGTAEGTTLEPSSVDFVTTGQAFHWFDPLKARAEFIRILKRDGWIAVFWNQRRTGSTPFLRAYERLLRSYGTDYRQVSDTTADESRLRQLFAGLPYVRRTFSNEQAFDLDGLRGRLLSSSYIPAESHPDHAPMLRELEEIFHAHQERGLVRVEYDAELYFEQAKPSAVSGRNS